VGTKILPQPGQDLIVVESEKRAKVICQLRIERQLNEEATDAMQRVKQREKNEKEQARLKRQQDDDAFLAGIEGKSDEKEIVEEIKVKEVPIIIKADSLGSLGAIQTILKDLPSADEITLKFISGGVGDVTESDVSLAASSKALLVGFNVKSSSRISMMTSSTKVTFILEKIIYSILDKVKEILGTMLKPSIEEVVNGEAEIQAIFMVSKEKKNDTKIAGCIVNKGLIQRGSRVRIVRKGKAITDAKVTSLRFMKDDVKEIKKGSECGIGLNFEDFEIGDLIQICKIREIPRRLGEPFQKRTL